MKKFFTLLVFTACLFTAKSQIQFVGGDTVTYSGMTDAGTTFAALGYIRNTGTSAVNIAWELVDSSAQPMWEYTGFCDPNLCYSFGLNRKVIFHLVADSSEPMKLDLIAHCVPGTGHVTCRLWNVADSANTVFNVVFRFNMSVNAACINGISEAEKAPISFYPNPVRTDLKLSLPQSLANGQIDIYDLIGSKVFSQPISSRETVKDFDLSALESGIYVARIYDGGKIIATKKFTKTK